MRVICQECEREYELAVVPDQFPCGHWLPDQTPDQIARESGKVLDELVRLYGSLGYTEEQALAIILGA